MGMGYGANFAEVISDKDLADIVGMELLSAFAEALDAFDSSEQEFVENSYGDDDFDEAVSEAYRAILEKFNEKTGLTLMLGYHDSESCGSRYDEVDGAYWAVDGMYQLTPEGKNWQHTVERKFFVTFG